jgi:hypothetical protein
MPKQKDLKRVVRARMQKTGESYTAARLQLLKKKEEPKPDYRKVAGFSDETIKAKSGRSWAEWVEALDKWGAMNKTHTEVAAHVAEQGIPGWWAQGVTVGYERLRGKRARGQRMSGAWEASKSRTFGIPVADLFEWFANARKRARWLGRPKMTVRKSTPPKGMRITWEDDTSVDLYFLPKGAAKSSVAVQHVKLGSKKQADEMKAYWSEKLDALGELLKK